MLIISDGREFPIISILIKVLIYNFLILKVHFQYQILIPINKLTDFSLFIIIMLFNLI